MNRLELSTKVEIGGERISSELPESPSAFEIQSPEFSVRYSRPHAGGKQPEMELGDKVGHP